MLSSRQFHEQIRTEEGAVTFLQSKSIIGTRWKCPGDCGESSVRLKQVEKTGRFIFKCSKCKSWQSVFVGTWLEGMHLTCLQVLDMIFAWSITSSHATIGVEGRLKGKQSTIDWTRFLREICVTAMEDEAAGMIGGEGSIVEIDETLVTKRKYNRGRCVEQVWVFGGIERGSGRCFFEIVQERSEAVLVEIIKRRIRPGTTIISDCWAAYRNLHEHGYRHMTVNHSENFVDPHTGAHTQTIESTWGALKNFLRGVGRNLGKHLNEYILEFLYRRKHHERLFDALLSDIAIQFPPRN